MPAISMTLNVVRLTLSAKGFASPSCSSARLRKFRGTIIVIFRTRFTSWRGGYVCSSVTPKKKFCLSPVRRILSVPAVPLVTNAGQASTTFLVLQGIGEYDYVPLA